MPKYERLSGNLKIEHLFKKGKSITELPLKLLYVEEKNKELFPARVMFVVSKKNFRKAVVRNLLKRRMREAYRSQKKAWYNNLQEKKTSCILAIIYVSKETANHSEINKAIAVLLSKCLHKLGNHSAAN